MIAVTVVTAVTVVAAVTVVTAAITAVATAIISAVSALVSGMHDVVQAFQALLKVAAFPTIQSTVVRAVDTFQSAEVRDFAKEAPRFPLGVGTVPESVLDSGVDVIELLAEPGPSAAFPILGIAVAIAAAVLAATVAATAVAAAVAAAQTDAVLCDSGSRQRKNSCGKQANC